MPLLSYRYANVALALVFSVAIVSVACKPATREPADRLPKPSAPERARVVRVIDGDTIELEGGERVRYLGIDTPETVHPDKPIECYGPEATERNKLLVEGKTVELLSDGPDRDAYGRLLRYVFVDGTFVNGDLVWQGYAFARSYGDTLRLYQTLVQLERAARDGRSGGWGACAW